MSKFNFKLILINLSCEFSYKFPLDLPASLSLSLARRVSSSASDWRCSSLSGPIFFSAAFGVRSLVLFFLASSLFIWAAAASTKNESVIFFPRFSFRSLSALNFFFDSKQTKKIHFFLCIYIKFAIALLVPSFVVVGFSVSVRFGGAALQLGFIV